MVRMGTRPAIERAGTVTPHLQRSAPDFYPNRTLRSTWRGLETWHTPARQSPTLPTKNG